MKTNSSSNFLGIGQKLAMFLVAGTALVTTGTAIAKISSAPRTTQAVEKASDSKTEEVEAQEIESKSTAPIDALITPKPIITDVEPSPTETISPAPSTTPTLAPSALPTLASPTPTAKPKITITPIEDDEDEIED